MKKKLILAAIAALATWGAVATDVSAAKPNCDNVRCMACPPGYHLKLTPPDCCACLPN